MQNSKHIREVTPSLKNVHEVWDQSLQGYLGIRGSWLGGVQGSVGLNKDALGYVLDTEAPPTILILSCDDFDVDDDYQDGESGFSH